jgi:gliding motility-associated-like protein
MKSLLIAITCCFFIVNTFSQARFTAPDTVCVTNPVAITNATVGASSYYWNFCTGNLNAAPAGVNLGVLNSGLTSPVYIDYVQENGNYYGFMTDNYVGQLIRLDFGNSLLNTPTSTNFGNLGGVLPVGTEGIQVVKNEGKWYAIIVGGINYNGNQPCVIKVEFGANITNPNPVATNWGNIGNLLYPHDLYVFPDAAGVWYGLTCNTDNNTITRFNFTNSFSNTPTAVNLGNIGNLTGPTGIHAINDNGNWYAFVTNANSSSLTRLDFGSSLLNTPTGQNLGNVGGLFHTVWDIRVIKYCGNLLAYCINADQSYNDIVKLDFNNNITSIPTAVSFGNIGNCRFPHCLSKIFRVGADLYTFIPNVANQTLTRLSFAGCNNASIPNSTSPNPGSITYNTPGTYNINLTTDDGLPTQSAFCKQVVVLPPPTKTPTQTIVLCAGSSVKIGAGVKYAQYTWNTGATTDSIVVSAPGIYWVQEDRFGCSNRDSIIVSACTTAQFTTPDTVCVNTPVTITNTSTNASSYYWNFCVADITQPPVAVNIGNPGNLSSPVFLDYVYVNNNYYAFVTNYNSGNLVRLDFGNSLLNNPTSVNLGNYGGILQSGSAIEGVQVVQNEGKWYAIIVGGNSNAGTQPRIVKIDFGANITSAGTATNWGNLGNMQQPVDLHVFKEGNNWYGLTINAENNTIVRFNFTNSFNNTPTAVNLGNIGGLLYPTGIYAINDNGFWRVFITNAGDNQRDGTYSSITRLDFGTSLLNTPTGVNLGNPGGVLHHPRDLTIMKFCGQIIGFAVNGNPNYNDLLRLNFNNDLTTAPTITSLGNTGNYNFPHSISRLFRVNDDVYAFITNVANNTITRLRFQGCTNASVSSSTLQNPAPVTYSTPGTYNINLTVDDGLPTQSSYCKQVVVLPAPLHTPTQAINLCIGSNIKIGTGVKNAQYTWNTGEKTDSIIVNNVGTWWVQTDRYGCTNKDTIVVGQLTLADFSFKQDICNPLAVQFSTASNLQNPYWSFGDGNSTTGNLSTSHTYAAYGNYTVKFGIDNGTCKDTISKNISINVTNSDIIFTPDTTICFNATGQLRAAPALSFCWSPTTYLNNPNIPNPVTATPGTMTYTYTAEVPGSNLITNGNFSNGNTAIGSSYTYSTHNVTEGEYTVGTNPKAWNNAMAGCQDHTGGTGNMLIVNGATQANVTVWSQTISIQPNTNYAFSAWLQNVNGGGINPPRLQFSINGLPIGNIFQSGPTPCNWSQFYSVWNSGNNTKAVIAVVNQNTIAAGNDFALDDLSFAPVYIQRESIKVSVDTPLVKTINDTTVCKNAPVPLQATGATTWSWSPATGLTNAAISNPIATPLVNTQYIVTGTNQLGCVAKDTVQINLFPDPVVNLGPDMTLCAVNNLVLNAGNPGSHYVWQDGSTAQTYTANSFGEYIVKVTDANNCSTSDSIILQPYITHFKASLVGRAICKGESVFLKASGGDVYIWSPAGSLNNAAQSSPIATPDTSTMYSVYVKENTCNFDTTMKVYVAVNPIPTVTAEKANDLDCVTHSTKLNATGTPGNTYRWSPVSGLDLPNSPSPVSTTDTTITYVVTGVNQFGCIAVDSVTVQVTSTGKVSFEVPNAFTPNSDGHNDCFRVRSWGGAQIEEFSVFNRWGQQVFSSNNATACWDGRYNGEPQPSGAYVYVIKAKTYCGNIKRTGTVMLIR